MSHMLAERKVRVVLPADRQHLLCPTSSRYIPRPTAGRLLRLSQCTRTSLVPRNTAWRGSGAGVLPGRWHTWLVVCLARCLAGDALTIYVGKEELTKEERWL